VEERNAGRRAAGNSTDILRVLTKL